MELFDSTRREVWVKIISAANTEEWVDLGKGILCQVKITTEGFNAKSYLEKMEAHHFCFVAAKTVSTSSKHTSSSISTGLFASKIYATRVSTHKGKWDIALAELNFLTVDIEIEAKAPNMDAGDEAFLQQGGEISDSMCAII
ncbi:MAG: hypothetical protein WC627_02690 [Legionella sp.]|jgi:hypothetical protein